jgi:mRNA interferase HicA
MMKRRDLLKQLARIAKERGEQLEQVEGGNHTKVKIGDQWTTVPRHSEIDDRLVRKIMKQIGEDK